jgi:iron complex outermembrane receptor protein
MSTTYTRGPVWGTLLLATSTVAGELSSQSDELFSTTMLDDIVVTATRYEEDVASVPASVSVVTEQDIASSPGRDVPDILKNEVGLHVYDIAGNGQSFRVDRSGFGATAALNTLVLVDGRRLNNPDLAGPDWKLIPLDRVERIEIVRGSRGSVLYGDNATDSVINIITKGGGDELKLGVEGAGGSYNTRSPSAYVSGAYEDLSYALSGRYYDSDGYRKNSATTEGDIGLDLDYQVADLANVRLSAGYHEDDAGLPGALRQSELDAGLNRRDTTHPLDFADTDDYYIQLTPEVSILDKGYFKVPLSYRARDQSFFASFAGGEFRGDTKIDFVSASPQLVVQEPIGGLDNTLTLGFDYYYTDEDIRNESLFFGTLDVGNFDLAKKNYGLYVQDEIYPIEPVALSAGYRWDRADYEFSPTPPGASDETDYEKDVLMAGVSYRFLDQSYLYLSFAQGFRYPVLDEIFSFFTNTINEDLAPQTSDDYEIGVRHHFTDNIYANLNLFRLNTKDEIFFNPTTFSNENLDAKTRRQGVEVSGGYDSELFSVSATYTYRDSEILDGVFSGNQVPNVPQHQASFDLVWRSLEGLTLTLNGMYVGERYLESDFANEFEKQDSYQVVNAKVSYAWDEYTAFLDLNNLFNEKYSAYGVLSTFPVEAAFYPSPELNFFAGVSYDY